MIQTEQFVSAIRQRGASFFTGVPDSLLQSLSAHLAMSTPAKEHVIAANEGNAIALSIGHYLATSKPAVVYLQNSGLGNTVNPLTSLADPEVYGIPMLLVIGWRGEPGTKDEPQHVKQGRISPAQLDALEIPYRVVGADDDIDVLVGSIWRTMQERSGPVALLVQAGALSEVKYKQQPDSALTLKREAAIATVLDAIEPGAAVIATTGKTGRELFELRKQRDEPHSDFLCVGGMGHTASIALGVCLGAPERQVVCLDGDGSFLMHMGAAAITGDLQPANLVHIVLNNGSHESVGGQPTVAFGISFEKIALGCGYRAFHQAHDQEQLDTILRSLGADAGPVLIEVLVAQGSRADLGRPTSTPQQNKDAFMAFLRR